MSVCAAAEVLMNCLNSFPAGMFDLYDEDPEARRTCYYTRTYKRLSRFVPARGKDNKCASRDTSSCVLFERGTKDRQPFSVCKTLRCFKLSFGSCAPFGQQTKATTECSPIPLALITPLSYQVRRMTRTNDSIEVYLYHCRHFCLENRRGVLKGYEPNEPYGAVMSRSLSMPSSRGLAAEAVEVNPFYSERLRQELVLRSQRPEHLPAEEDEGRVPPVQDGRPPTGKGRGGDGTGLFATPPSLERPTVFGQQPTGMQPQGAMPMETPPTVQQTMGAMHGSERHEEVGMSEKKVGSVRPAVDELQRDLEVELVDFLRQQNAQLMIQVSDLKMALEARGDQASAGSSPWSTVVEGESLGKRSAMGAKRWSSRSPRPTRKQGHGSPVKLAGDGRVKKDDKLQCTPNGTRIPDGPPPMDDVSRMPSCPPPPVPPFSIPHTADAASDMTEKMDLKAYEVCQDGPLRGRMGDPGWKPTSEKSLTPQEAKSAWLEREVNSLKKVFGKSSN